MLSYLFRIVSVRFADEVQAVRSQDLALVPLLAQPHVLVILFLRYCRHLNSPHISSMSLGKENTQFFPTFLHATFDPFKQPSVNTVCPE